MMLRCNRQIVMHSTLGECWVVLVCNLFGRCWCLCKMCKTRSKNVVACGCPLRSKHHLLLLQAQANSVAVASLKELPVITADGSHYHQQQQILTALCRLAGLQTTCTVVDSNANSRISLPGTAVVAPPPAAAGRTVLLTCHQQEQNHQQQQQQDRTEESATSLALGHITNLRLGLSSRVIGIFKSEYDDLWLDVISSRPPWRDVDFLYVLQKHWRSTLQVTV